ncbi:nuclear transport factor 2 family protein [Sphingosinicella sp. BN140058]|uniref:nuclear transport factor 2 family protein n=1 Tax=Sphingosinicella sp. BN140058 TaxID=1892855 RepID=UPI0013EE1210|nr:nuclear transport factor 2 family protein [Sphingosinicella sp. BN140058]
MLGTIALLLTSLAPAPAAQHPHVDQVLARNRRLEAAIAAGDVATLRSLFAPEFRLQNSANEILTAEQVLEQFRSGATRFAGYEREVQAAYPSGESIVVLMGEEKVTRAGAPSAPIRRRFTSIWRKTPDGWRQIARQSTNVAAPEPR